MRRTEAAQKRRRRHAWKAACVLFLGILSSSVGCRWTGDPTGEISTGERGGVSSPRDCLEALTPPRSPESPLGMPAQPVAPGTMIPAGDTSAAGFSDVVQASFQGNPDGPVAEGSDRARQEVAASRSPLPQVATAPVQDKQPTNEAKDEKKEEKSLREKATAEGAYQVDLTLPSPANGMATPVIPPPQKVLPLTLAESLAIAGAANPVIALAQQAVRLSQAELFLSRLLLMPNVNVGADYDLNNGPVQSSFGAIRKVDRQSVLYGLGTYSVVAETVKIPGLFIFTPLTDAFFSPLVNRQVVANRRFAAAATNNRVLLDVCTAYLDLLAAEGRLAVIRQSMADFQEIVRLTGIFANRGAGREGDANRARGDELALEYEEKKAQEEVAVAAADLSRLLNLDPSVRLQTGAVPIQIITFVDPKVPLPQLLEIASRNRPELLAAAAAIRASQIRLRREIVRPLIPTVWAGFSADDFGGGAVASTRGNVPNPHTGNTTGDISSTFPGQTTPKFGRITGRTDVDVIFFWSLQNAGVGNLAHVRGQRAELNQSYAERLRILNEVGFEVSEAYNTSAQKFLAIGIERRRVQEVTQGLQRDLDRLRFGVGIRGKGRPIEVLLQAERLWSARQDLLAAIVGFDRAQFQLFVALGQPPNLVVEDDKTAPPPPPPVELPPPELLPPVKQ